MNKVLVLLCTILLAVLTVSINPSITSAVDSTLKARPQVTAPQQSMPNNPSGPAAVDNTRCPYCGAPMPDGMRGNGPMGNGPMGNGPMGNGPMMGRGGYMGRDGGMMDRDGRMMDGRMGDGRMGDHQMMDGCCYGNGWYGWHGGWRGGEGGAGGALYGFGFIGALIYFLKRATSFGNGALGVLKAIVWPGVLVYLLLGYISHKPEASATSTTTTTTTAPSA